ncbi:MAG: Rrf2 family transcriptional regulator [Phycisphaerae bacterium]|nr:Rrf2 family transcriptional regulator [Phycisphaerae bacterium]
MFTLTRKTEYALIALSHLAAETDRLASAREIADEYRLPLPVLTNVLKTLNRCGIVGSERGTKGGYRLAQDPYQISLAQLIRAVEGPARLVRCTGGQTGPPRRTCELVSRCPVRPAVLKVHQRMQRFLEGVSIGEIVANGANRTAPQTET